MALVVVTGGARSGKSAMAQELARVRSLDGARIAVAVFGEPALDAEMSARVERHRADRPRDFRVIEAADSRSWLEEVSRDELLLLDCLGTLVARVLDEGVTVASGAPLVDLPEHDLPPGVAEDVERSVMQRVDAIVARRGDTIVVTNEVGDGVVPAYPSGRLFRDVLGRANRRLVGAADAAYLVVCGRALDLHALPTTLRWPTD